VHKAVFLHQLLPHSSKKLLICWYWAFAIVTIRSHHPSHSSTILFWLPVTWHCHQLVFFSSYLSSRSFHVKCGSTLSSSQTSSYGVPQGSVLGPLLFIMFITPQLVTLALSLMNISPSLTKSQHFLNPAILLFVHFVVSVLTSIKKTASTIATSIVHSKLHYCNSFYHNLPNSQSHRLQLIQNSLARTVFNTPKTCHITPILASLHWLKIKKRIEYKLFCSYIQNFNYQSGHI